MKVTETCILWDDQQEDDFTGGKNKSASVEEDDPTSHLILKSVKMSKSSTQHDVHLVNNGPI